jgi:peptidase YpeB-like protein
MTPLLRCLGIVGLLLGTAAANPAAAGQGRGDHDTPATQDPSESGRWQYRATDCQRGDDGWVMCRDNSGYWYRDHYDPDFGGGWGNGYGGGYDYGVLPPQTIVHYLHRNGFSYISEPALAGRFYQVKALDPRGRKVKLYIDAYSGEIVKVKD